jgi:hypothetical protein
MDHRNFSNPPPFSGKIREYFPALCAEAGFFFRNLLSLILIVFLDFSICAQNSGVKGRISDESGNPVPFVSIGVEKSGGGIANEEGFYRIPLQPGTYTVLFHCLGYKSEKREVQVGAEFIELNLVLSEQILQTKEVLIASGNEDPAYAIMRKTIERARINRMLVNSYKAEAYIRGSGRFINVPKLLKPMLKKQGLDANTVLFKESLEDIEFRQPNSYIEKVKAARSNFGKLEARQNLIKYELYSPRFGETISPLSPSAFRYYSFQYLGAFTDLRHEVFKIKVIPKRPSDDVWSGEISVVDGLWCIHSADLKQEEDGVTNRFKQEYSPVEGIWLPSHIRLDAKGKALGIEFEAIYNAVIRKYRLTKNEKLYQDYKSLEQKLEEKTDEVIRANPVKPDLKKQEKEDRKMLRQLAKTYVKERILNRKKENREQQLPGSVVANRVFLEDSSAFNNDSLFWKENRLVPLTEAEEKSYVKMDSIFKKAEEKDTSAAWKKSFSKAVFLLALGSTYSFGKEDSLKRKSWELKFFGPLNTFGLNAVEGYHLEQRIWLKKYFGQSLSRFTDQRPYIQFGPDVRYSFGRRKLLVSGIFQYGRKSWTLQLAGGSSMRQMAGAPVVHPELNLLYARFEDTNLMKVFQANHISLDFLRKLTGRVEAEIGFRFEQRLRLENSSFRSIYGKSFDFEPNGWRIPGGRGIDSLPDPGRLAEIRLGFNWYPGMVSGLYNGRQVFRLGNGPAFRAELRHAIPGIGGSVADYTRAEFSWRQSAEIWRATHLELFGRVSAFLRKGFVAPMDAQHVAGNQTIFIDGASLEQFRNLPYYSYSNASRLLEFHSQFYRDRLLLGWIFPSKKAWREGILSNFLLSPYRPVFREFGYALDNLFGILHLAVVASGEQQADWRWRFLVGMSYRFGVEPKSLDRNPGILRTR